jgi:aromatic ring hydroxylase
MYPALQPLQVGRTWAPRMYPRLMEMVRRLGAGGLMQLPASFDAFDSPIGPDLEKYYRGAHLSASDKVKLFKLAWDIVGSDFGSRHLLYELFYAGDPSVLMAGFHREFNKQAIVSRVQQFLGATANNP